ncbi:MAG: type II CAAX endopeptidase family protein [Byssovorax sp.]
MSQDDSPDPEEADDAPEAADPPASSAASGPLDAPREAISVAAGVTLATGLVMTFAFDPARAGTPAMLIAIGLNYALITALALYRLKQRGELAARFRPAGGDLTLGAVTAGLLYGAAHLVEHTVASRGTPREAWVMRLYLQLGDPQAVGRVLVGGAVFVVAALEEIAWRGLVMRSLEGVLDKKRALALTSALFAVAHLPTLYLLRDPTAGYNPLIVLAALGCGTVWGVIYLRTDRLLPSLFAHAFFSWAIVEFPIWRP